jgi:hypothetical protein
MFARACTNATYRSLLPPTLAESAQDTASAVLSRAERLLRSGAFAKGVSSLNSRAPCEPTLEALQFMTMLHPADGPAPCPRPATVTIESAPKFTMRQVRGALRSFPLGSSGGLDGLKPQILVDACSHTSSEALHASSIIVNMLASGSLPRDAAPYFFGAVLTAIPKIPSGLRPIASGHVFRRAAGKLLANTAPAAEKFLQDRRQIGVRVRSGIEAAQLGIRRYASGLHPGRVILKLDVKNAFNSAFRAHFLNELAKLAPTLCPYAFAAYGTHSVLYFGEHKIMSRAGVQQGDPLGALFFSIIIALIRDRVFEAMPTELREAIDFEVSYLDDITIAGPALAVRAFLDHFVLIAAEFGLHLNMSKTELVHHPQETLDTLALFADVGCRNTALAFTLLGAPCGTDITSAATTITSACLAHCARIKAIGLLAHSQVAYAALRFCGAQPLANYRARAVGAIGLNGFTLLDAATLQAFASAAVELHGISESIGRLPARLGGLGFRSIKLIAPVAFICACADAAPIVKTLFSPTAFALLPPDPFQILGATLDPLFHTTPFRQIASDLEALLCRATSADPPRPAQHSQRLFTRRIEQVQRELLFPQLTDIAQARLQSCSANMASSWLAPLPGSDDPLWLPSSHFIVLVRFRLGLALDASDSTCVMCGKTCDRYGYHSLLCRGRYGLHNTVRDTIFAMAAAANWVPTLEPHILPDIPSRRSDILARIGPNSNNGDVYAIDVAVVAPHAQVWLPHALKTPGGAATEHERHKVAIYGTSADHPGVTVIGCVADTYGAWGESAVTLITKLARAWGHRFDLHPSRAVPLVFGALSTRLQSGVAKILLCNLQQRCSTDAALDRALQAVPLLAGTDVHPTLTQRGLTPA